MRERLSFAANGGMMAGRTRVSFTVFVVSDCDLCAAGLELIEEIARTNGKRSIDLRVIDVLGDPAAVVKSRVMSHPTFLVEVGGKERVRMTGSFSRRKILYRLLPALYSDDEVALAQLRQQLGSPTENFPSGPFRGRVRQAQKVELISQVPLFQGLSKRQLAQLARFVDEVHRDKDEVLINEGEAGDEFFVLVEGRVRVAKRGGQPTLLGAGECFGEMSLLDDQPRSATVTTTAPSTLLVIHRGDFERWLMSTPSVMRALLTTVSQRLR